MWQLLNIDEYEWWHRWGWMKVRLKVWVGLIEFELTHSCWCTTTSPTSLKPILSHDCQVFLLFLMFLPSLFIGMLFHLFVCLFFNWHHHLFLLLLRFELFITKHFFPLWMTFVTMKTTFVILFYFWLHSPYIYVS